MGILTRTTNHSIHTVHRGSTHCEHECNSFWRIGRTFVKIHALHWALVAPLWSILLSQEVQAGRQRRLHNLTMEVAVHGKTKLMLSAGTANHSMALSLNVTDKNWQGMCRYNRTKGYCLHSLGCHFKQLCTLLANNYRLKYSWIPPKPPQLQMFSLPKTDHPSSFASICTSTLVCMPTYVIYIVTYRRPAPVMYLYYYTYKICP